MIKVSYIRKLPNGKYRVYSEKGKHMGTYDSMPAAKKRLQQIEFFKRKSDLLYELNKLADYFDDIGLFKEANIIDQLTKQAADLSPEEYERYYGKSKYEGSTVGKELDVSTPQGYKQYYGREMPKSEMSATKKIEEKPSKSAQDSLANIIQDMAAILQDEDYGYGGGPGGYQKLDVASGSDAATGMLRFGNSATGAGFMHALKNVGFSPLSNGTTDRMYSAGGDMKYGGKIIVYRSDVPKTIIMSAFSDAPDNEKYREIVSAMRLMRFYLDFS